MYYRPFYILPNTFLPKDLSTHHWPLLTAWCSVWGDAALAVAGAAQPRRRDRVGGGVQAASHQVQYTVTL